jgi:hypothetical protein
LAVKNRSARGHDFDELCNLRRPKIGKRKLPGGLRNEEVRDTGVGADWPVRQGSDDLKRPSGKAFASGVESFGIPQSEQRHKPGLTIGYEQHTYLQTFVVETRTVQPLLYGRRHIDCIAWFCNKIDAKRGNLTCGFIFRQDVLTVLCRENPSWRLFVQVQDSTFLWPIVFS